jgi:hypothetical protein
LGTDWAPRHGDVFWGNQLLLYLGGKLGDGVLRPGCFRFSPLDERPNAER